MGDPWRPLCNPRDSPRVAESRREPRVSEERSCGFEDPRSSGSLWDPRQGFEWRPAERQSVAHFQPRAITEHLRSNRTDDSILISSGDFLAEFEASACFRANCALGIRCVSNDSMFAFGSQFGV